MNALLPRAKLAAILGMLGSDHDGEVLAAARAAERLRREAGTTWSELLGHAASEPVLRHWRSMLRDVQARPQLLSRWEARFIASIARQISLSPKQVAVLRRLAERAQRHASS